MKRNMLTGFLVAIGLALAAVATTTPAIAQFAAVEETTESRWGATVYGGGDIDSIGNAQVGLRVNYRVFAVKPLGRLSPEVGLEFRKNYLLLKAGGRVDSREFFRLSGFAGGGVLRIQDFTNSTSSGEIAASDQTWFTYFGGKLRMPSLGGVPILGKILGGLPIEGVSLFVAEEVSDLKRPSVDGVHEFQVNEWYRYALQFGVMVGTASGWYK